jgi:hypothetical protein
MAATATSESLTPLDLQAVPEILERINELLTVLIEKASEVSVPRWDVVDRGTA